MAMINSRFNRKEHESPCQSCLLFFLQPLSASQGRAGAGSALRQPGPGVFRLASEGRECSGVSFLSQVSLSENTGVSLFVCWFFPPCEPVLIGWIGRGFIHPSCRDFLRIS